MVKKERERRYDVVDQMLREGVSARTIQRMLSQEWGITRRQVRKYITTIYKQWDEVAVPSDERTARRRAQLEGILEVAMRQNPPDLRNAIQALDRLCRIDGCYPSPQFEINNTMNIDKAVMQIHEMTPNQRNRRIKELLDMRQRFVTNPLAKLNKGNGRGDNTDGNSSLM